MMRYLLRRVGHALFLLAGVSMLAFLFTSLAPGTYFDEMRLNPQIAPRRLRRCVPSTVSTSLFPFAIYRG